MNNLDIAKTAKELKNILSTAESEPVDLDDFSEVSPERLAAEELAFHLQNREDMYAAYLRIPQDLSARDVLAAEVMHEVGSL